MTEYVVQYRAYSIDNQYVLIKGTPKASFTKEVNPRLAESPLITDERLANLGLTSLLK